jgi:hypothetical protein
MSESFRVALPSAAIVASPIHEAMSTPALDHRSMLRGGTDKYAQVVTLR